MSTHNESTTEAVARIVISILAWFGSVKLGDIQAIVAIVSGVAVLTYTVMQTYLLWRDRINQPKGDK